MAVNPDLLVRAAALIRAGRLVAFPTETVYGLGANALDAGAVDRIYLAKNRPSSSPLIVHVDSIEMARSLASDWSEQADILAARFWPGPLTLVVSKAAHVPDRVTAGLPTVGLRQPNHAVALALLREAGVPIAAPSANRFTELSPTCADHVVQSLGDAVDLVLDDGPSAVGIESTVVSLAGPEPALLRPGMISQADIEEVIGPVAVIREMAEGARHPSPGLHERHYSPRTPLYLTQFGPLPSFGRGAYLWLTQEEPAAWGRQMPAEPAEYGAELYAILHDLDNRGFDWIAVEIPPPWPEWDGINDRLKRAASAML